MPPAVKKRCYMEIFQFITPDVPEIAMRMEKFRLSITYLLIFQNDSPGDPTVTKVHQVHQVESSWN
jgi:hypothetical protein